MINCVPCVLDHVMCVLTVTVNSVQHCQRCFCFTVIYNNVHWIGRYTCRTSLKSQVDKARSSQSCLTYEVAKLSSTVEQLHCKVNNLEIRPTSIATQPTTSTAAAKVTYSYRKAAKIAVFHYHHRLYHPKKASDIDSGTPCRACAPLFAKLQQQISDLWNAHKKLVAEVTEIKRIAGNIQQSAVKCDEHVKLAVEVSEMKTVVSRLSEEQHAGNASHIEELNLTANVCKTLNDMNKRKKNVVVTGLPEVALGLQIAMKPNVLMNLPSQLSVRRTSL